MILRLLAHAVIVCCFAALAPNAFAQAAGETEATEQTATGGVETPAAAAPARIVYTTPRRALDAFIEAFRDEREDAMLAVLRLPTGAIDREGRAHMASRLGRVLETLGEDRLAAVHDDELRDRSDTVYTLRAPADRPGEPDVVYELRFVREGVDGTGGWVIDARDAEAIDAAFAGLGLDAVVNWLRAAGMGPLIDGSLLGLRYYQWLGLFLLIFFAVVFDVALRVLTRIATQQYMRRSETESEREKTAELIRRVGKPVGLAGGAVVVYWALPLLGLPYTGEAVLRLAAKAAGLLAVVLAAYRMVDLVSEFFAAHASRTHSKFDDLLVPLVRKASKIFIVAFGVLFLAESFDLPIASIIAGLGIGGLAFAFAAKDTIENLFGSVAVILDRPFSVGDWVMIDGVEGTVEELGFRSTRVRTFYNSLVTIPNATLVRAQVDNYGRRTFRRFRTVLNLTYSTPPDKVEAFCEGIREIVRRHPYTRKDSYEIHLNDFGAHSIDVLVYIFFKTPDWSTELRERHRFCLDVLRLAKQLRVEFAFPTQTIHLDRATPSELFDGREPEDDARTAGKVAATRIMTGAEFHEKSV